MTEYNTNASFVTFQLDTHEILTHQLLKQLTFLSKVVFAKKKKRKC